MLIGAFVRQHKSGKIHAAPVPAGRASETVVGPQKTKGAFRRPGFFHNHYPET